MVDEKLGKPREAAQFYQGVIDVTPDNARRARGSRGCTCSRPRRTRRSN